ncbi:MAG: J domain-containing protein [Proteobacteria bacterium]|nr:J domain-containing protein [Pseudomonadota bacterium]
MLSDADKRARYDEFGVDGLAEGFDADRARMYRRWGGSGGPRSGAPGGFSLEDLFGDLFGRPRSGAGRDVEAALAVDLLDVVRAAEVSVEFAHRPGLKVRLPPGSGDGTRIRLAGQGDPAPGGGPRGDLFLELRVRPHPLLRRDGDDLHLDVPVTLPELVRGAKIRVPTPDGPVGMTLPSHSRPGSVLRVRGKGCVTREPERRGDLYVHLTLHWPDAPDEDIERLADAAESLYSGRDVRAGLRL